MTATIVCDYRIYPAWFAGGNQPPMRELAERSALVTGRQVMGIDVVGSGFDRCGGHFVDFRVTYSSTDIAAEATP